MKTLIKPIFSCIFSVTSTGVAAAASNVNCHRFQDLLYATSWNFLFVYSDTVYLIVIEYNIHNHGGAGFKSRHAAWCVHGVFNHAE